MGVSGQRDAPAALNPGERIAGTHWTGGWMDLRAGLNTETRGKIICLCRGPNPVQPTFYVYFKARNNYKLLAYIVASWLDFVLSLRTT
jgi:hypothetical protein